MKLPNNYILLALVFLISGTSFTTLLAQTTLFQDDFESGSGNWILNGGTGSNTWVVNNIYAGLPPLILDTPSQPGGVTNGPNSSYLHVTNTSICGIGVCNSNYDTGAPSDQSASMASNINASGFTNVSLSFYYLCAGVPGQDFGTLFYSLNGGVSWTGTGTSYQSTTSWTLATVSLPAWSNVASLRFRFRWQNSATSGADPAFSIDQMVVTGTPQATQTIATGTLPNTSFCPNASLIIPYTVTGTFAAGNVFTAELSDANGSFAAPVSIGSLSSTTSGSISATIPSGTVAGSGYRIRVVSSTPAVTGSDNGVNLTVLSAPVAGLLGASVDSICPGTAVSLNLTGHNGNIQWLTSPDGITWGLDPNLSGNTIVATPTQTTYFQAQVSNGCGASLSNSVSVVVVPAPVAAFNWTHQPPFTVLFSDQSTGGPLAYLWDFGDGNLSTLPNPSHTYTGLGFYNVLLTVTNEYGCTDTSLQQVVIQTTGLQDVPRSTVFVWPTIACEQVQIRYSEGPYQFELVDLSGKRVFTFHTTNAEGVMTLGMQSLPSGAYLLRSSSVDQQLVLKVFKE